MDKYRKKPVVIEAERITEENYIELAKKYILSYSEDPAQIIIEEGMGNLTGFPGEWLIKSNNGDMYFRTDSHLRETYEKVEKGD